MAWSEWKNVGEIIPISHKFTAVPYNGMQNTSLLKKGTHYILTIRYDSYNSVITDSTISITNGTLTPLKTYNSGTGYVCLKLQISKVEMTSDGSISYTSNNVHNNSNLTQYIIVLDNIYTDINTKSMDSGSSLNSSVSLAKGNYKVAVLRNDNYFDNGHETLIEVTNGSYDLIYENVVGSQYQGMDLWLLDITMTGTGTLSVTSKNGHGGKIVNNIIVFK